MGIARLGGEGRLRQRKERKREQRLRRNSQEGERKRGGGFVWWFVKVKKGGGENKRQGLEKRGGDASVLVKRERGREKAQIFSRTKRPAGVKGGGLGERGGISGLPSGEKEKGGVSSTPEKRKWFVEGGGGGKYGPSFLREGEGERQSPIFLSNKGK